MIKDPNTTRSDRWVAKWELHKLDGSVGMNGSEYDPYAQFYLGLIAAKANSAGSAGAFFISAMIAGDGTETSARNELIKFYAVNGMEFAALRLAETDASEKGDDLLRILSECAQRIGDLPKAIEFEKRRSGGGDTDRIAKLRQLSDIASRRATDLIVDSANTRKL
jgi:hypothetical protein